MEAQPGVLECGRPVFLEEEVPNPGESVADNEGHEDVAESEGEEDGPDELKKGKDGSDEVQSTIGPIGVLRHVEGIELLQSPVLLI